MHAKIISTTRVQSSALIKNGHLYMYIRYRNNSQKNEAEELKKLKYTTSLYYSHAISTPKIPVTFNKFEKAKLENFDFVHLLSSSFFFLSSFTSKAQKLYGLCEF